VACAVARWRVIFNTKVGPCGFNARWGHVGLGPVDSEAAMVAALLICVWMWGLAGRGLTATTRRWSGPAVTRKGSMRLPTGPTCQFDIRWVKPNWCRWRGRRAVDSV
jgi:hypothetical protein